MRQLGDSATSRPSTRTYGPPSDVCLLLRTVHEYEARSIAPLSGGHVGCDVSRVRVRDSVRESKAPSFRLRTARGPFPRSWSPALNLTPEKATDAPPTPIRERTAATRSRTPRCLWSRSRIRRACSDAHASDPRVASRPARARRLVALLERRRGLRPPHARRGRLHFFSIAQGSAMECAAAIDLLRVNRHVAFHDARRAKHKARRVIQMLVGLRRV